VDHEVKELILSRLAGDTDRARLGLIVEGGAMRAVTTASMVCALEDLGMTGVFDDLYATSVGAITGAYFLAGQAQVGTSTFLDDLRDRRFINPLRPLIGRPALSLHFAYEELTRHYKPLNYQAVLSSPTRLHVIASSVKDKRPYDLGCGYDGQSMRDRFKASSCLPMIAGRPQKVDGNEYFDGGIFDSLPFRAAIENGCTHLLILKSWPAGLDRSKPHWLERALAARALSGRLMAAYMTRAERYNQDSDLLEQANGGQDIGAKVMTISPGPEAAIGHLERNRSSLLLAGRSGASQVKMALTGLTGPTPEVLR
jgi:predicted patatin/cPLA2 family phospholipase